jgi:hypothetical protein
MPVDYFPAIKQVIPTLRAVLSCSGQHVKYATLCAIQTIEFFARGATATGAAVRSGGGDGWTGSGGSVTDMNANANAKPLEASRCLAKGVDLCYTQTISLR